MLAIAIAIAIGIAIVVAAVSFATPSRLFLLLITASGRESVAVHLLLRAVLDEPYPVDGSIPAVPRDFEYDGLDSLFVALARVAEHFVARGVHGSFSYIVGVEDGVGCGAGPSGLFVC